MVTLSCLEDDASRSVASAGPARELGDEPIGSFCTAKIGHQQDVVDPHHRGQRDAGKVVSFSDQLRTDEHLTLPGTERAQNPLVCPASLCRVRIHSCDLRSRKGIL